MVGDLTATPGAIYEERGGELLLVGTDLVEHIIVQDCFLRGLQPDLGRWHEELEPVRELHGLGREGVLGRVVLLVEGVVARKFGVVVKPKVVTAVLGPSQDPLVHP